MILCRATFFLSFIFFNQQKRKEREIENCWPSLQILNAFVCSNAENNPYELTMALHKMIRCERACVCVCIWMFFRKKGCKNGLVPVSCAIYCAMYTLHKQHADIYLWMGVCVCMCVNVCAHDMRILSFQFAWSHSYTPFRSFSTQNNSNNDNDVEE